MKIKLKNDKLKITTENNFESDEIKDWIDKYINGDSRLVIIADHLTWTHEN